MASNDKGAIRNFGLGEERGPTKEAQVGCGQALSKHSVVLENFFKIGSAYRGAKWRTPWWGEEVSHSVRLKLEVRRKWMKSRSAEDGRNYVIARNDGQKVKRGSKEESWRKIGEDLKAVFRRTRKLLYSLANGFQQCYKI